MGGRPSAQADLGQDALAGEQLGGKADHEAQHGQTAIPGFSEGNEAEAGGGVSHGRLSNVEIIVTACEVFGGWEDRTARTSAWWRGWLRQGVSGQVAERLAWANWLPCSR